MIMLSEVDSEMEIRTDASNPVSQELTSTQECNDSRVTDTSDNGVSSSNMDGNDNDDSADAQDDSEEGEEDDEDEHFMEPITDSRLVTLQLRDLNQHLICYQCKGYFRHAFTIAECLHTFCKSCIFKYFAAKNNSCPRCNISLGPNPHQSIMFDRTLQELVDKIMPHLEKKDHDEEIAFYKKHGFKRRIPEEVEKELSASVVSSDIQIRSLPTVSGGNIRFRLLPDTSVPEVHRLKPVPKTALQACGEIKVMHLRRFICRRLDIKDSSRVEIYCKGGLLGPELSLDFIRRTRWFDNSKDLTLHYRKTQEY